MSDAKSPVIAPFKPGDLPPLPGSFWELVGPGAVLVGVDRCR
jgi:hypothetical protein